MIANFTMFDLGEAGFDVYCGGSGSTHFILDTIRNLLHGEPAARQPARVPGAKK